MRLKYFRETLNEKLDPARFENYRTGSKDRRIARKTLTRTGQQDCHWWCLNRKKNFTKALPEDPEIDAWCADLSEDLSGAVGTIEIGGQLETGKVLIRPGYDGRADFDAGRDGQLMHFLAMRPWLAIYNFVLMPGWQRWMPTYRVGTITEIDEDTCSVTIDSVISIHQGLDVTGQN